MPLAKAKKGITRKKIEGLLEENDGLSASEIQEKLGMKSLSSVHYHLNQIRKGKKVKKDGTIKRSKSRKVHSDKGFTEVDIQVARVTGRIEELIRGYAQSIGVPFGAFAERVAVGLHALASG